MPQNLPQLLSEDETLRPEAREVCFRGLSENPSNALLRLLLAKLFYFDNMAEFSVRELLYIRERTTGSEALDKLIDAFGGLGEKTSERHVSRGSSDEQEDDSVVAEVDLDADFTDALEEVLGELDNE